MPAPLPESARVIARIKYLRKQRGFSAQALADAITAKGYDVSRVSVSSQEAGRVQAISVDQVVAASKVFDMPIVNLLECSTCSNGGDAPPGFACIACGAGSRCH